MRRFSSVADARSSPKGFSITTRALVERNATTMRLITHHESEKPRSIQLYGVDPATTEAAVRILVEEDRADHIDLNFGCPVPKVTRKGGGAALPWKLGLFRDIVTRAARAAGDIPLTVKMRKGIDVDHLTYLDAGRIAEDAGFEYALSQTRYAASYGADKQHEATSFSLALLAATEKLKVIAAVHPGMWHPGVLAKFIITADHISNGRAAVNIVSGWFRGEFHAIGEHWLDHDERYRRSEEFIRALRGIWSEDAFTLKGDFYRFNDYSLKPKPIDPQPEIFQGGSSRAAQPEAMKSRKRSEAGVVERLAVARGVGAAAGSGVGVVCSSVFVMTPFSSSARGGGVRRSP